MLTATAACPLPAPRRLQADELLFWFVFAAHSLLPGRWQPAVDLFGCPVMTQDLGMVALGLTLAAWRWTDLRFPARPWQLIGGWLLLVMAWGAISVFGWAGTRDQVDAIGRLMPMVSGAGAFLAAYVLVSSRDAAQLRALLDRTALFLAAIGLAYAMKSLLAPGMELSFVRDNEQRARGALYGPAVGHLALLPALGLAAGNVLMAAGRDRWLWGGAAAALLIALVGLGSRGALLGIGVFAFLGLVRMPGGGRRLVLLGGLVAVALGALLFVAAVAETTSERMQETDDPFRSRTYETAFTALRTADPGQLVAGRGLGAVWPWYAEDAGRYNWESHDASMQFWYNSPWGSTMLHAHSMALYLTIEMGLPGLLFPVALAWTLLWIYRQAGRATWSAGLAAGLAASVTAIAFDLPVFKNITLSCLWWILLLGAIMLLDRPPEEPTRA